MALDPARRARILRTATDLFSAYGYRGTSMDALAQEAGVAKPTLYAYYADKDAVFTAVVETVLDRVLEDARRAAATDGPLEERLTEMLASKFTRIFELVHSSPHASELLSSSQADAQDAAERADASFRALLGSTVAAAARAGELDLARARTTRPAFVEALLQCGYGADALATSPADHRERLRRQVRLMLVGAQSR